MAERSSGGAVTGSDGVAVASLANGRRRVVVGACVLGLLAAFALAAVARIGDSIGSRLAAPLPQIWPARRGTVHFTEPSSMSVALGMLSGAGAVVWGVEDAREGTYGASFETAYSKGEDPQDVIDTWWKRRHEVASGLYRRTERRPRRLVHPSRDNERAHGDGLADGLAPLREQV